MPDSHTSTSEWQSFEERMRHRRLERCLLRASAALDADVPDIAQQVLEEARTLDSDHPELQEVTRRLLVASNPLPAPDRPLAQRRTSPVVFAFLVMLLLWGAASTDAARAKGALKWVLTLAGSAATSLSPSVMQLAPAHPLEPLIRPNPEAVYWNLRYAPAVLVFA